MAVESIGSVLKKKGHEICAVALMAAKGVAFIIDQPQKYISS
jgi:hypothetical protein